MMTWKEQLLQVSDIFWRRYCDDETINQTLAKSCIKTSNMFIAACAGPKARN